MVRFLFLGIILCLGSHAQDINARIEELTKSLSEQQQTIKIQAEQIKNLETLIAHDQQQQPTYRKIIPADKILGASFVLSFGFACTEFLDSGNTARTLLTFISAFYTIYATLKIIRNAATVAGNTQLTSTMTKN